MDNIECKNIRTDATFDCWPWLYWSQHNPNGIALTYGEYVFTWHQLNSRVDEYANQLSGQGLRQDHIVVAISTNCPDVLWLYLACLRLGACCVVLDPKQGSGQLNEKLDTLAARFIWRADLESDTLHELEYGDAEQLVFTSESVPLISTGNKVKVQAHDTEWQGQRLASVVFTSGSSGKAKAVAHCANNHLHSAAGLLAVFSYTAQDSWLLSLPLFHVSGLAIVWRWLFAGGQIVLSLGENFVELLSQVTHASLVPTQLRRYLNDIAISRHPSHLKRILLGGAVIPVVLTDKAKALGIDCWSGYGMTEMASTVTAKQADSSTGVGTVLAHRDLMIDDQQIKVRGDCLGLGYYYRGSLRSMTDCHGWLTTGDLGKKASDNCVNNELFILGRVDNMFISGGENIHPEHIERALLSHPLINQALVFPSEDSDFGQRPIAVIDSIAQLSTKEMNKFLQNKLVKFMWPINYYQLPDSISVSGIKLIRSSVQLWVTSLSK